MLAVLATQAAWAAAPGSNTLPGNFSTNVTGVTYAPTTSGSTNNGTIATAPPAGSNVVLQWGGTAQANKISAPSGFTTNTGFSIGQGATLNITNTNGPGNTLSVLVTDQTGSPSQIFGTLTTSLVANTPLFVANANGVIVGPAGVINNSANGNTGGVALLGYLPDLTTSPTSFPTTGTVVVTNTTIGGAGPVTIMNGAAISGGPLLVASNGTVNIGALTNDGTEAFVVAGPGFTSGTGGSVAPTGIGTGPTVASGSAVNFTAPATLTIDQLNSTMPVNNAANLTISTAIAAPGNLNVTGLFTNTGQVTQTSNLGANELAGGLANLGTIKETGKGAFGNDLVISSTKGNVQNTGVLVLPAAADLEIFAANIDLEGEVQIGTKALSTTNQLTFLDLETTATPASQNGGVVDIGTSLFSGGGAYVAGNAIRVISGGIFDSGGEIDLVPGTNAAGVMDPFNNNAGMPGMASSLNYTLSTFPGTLVQETAPGGEIFVLNPAGSTSFSTSPGLNLNGQLSVTGSGTPEIFVIANNINSNNGLAGGFSVPNGGIIDLQFFGNVNNPSGTGSFLNNYVPVTVGPNGTKAGTVQVQLAGPSANSATAQNVNLLVQGNVNLADGSGTIPYFPGFSTPPLVAPGPFPTAPISPYANNHLVVTATGNIGLDPSQVAGLSNPNIFYWPGLVWLTAGATASNPSAAPNSTASIALGDVGGVFTAGTSTTVNLSNILAADLTKASVNGTTGLGGVHYLASSVNLTPGSGAAGTTTISNNSWVNFLTANLASAFQTTNPTQFTGGTIQANGQVNTQQLPAADFQPK